MEAARHRERLRSRSPYRRRSPSQRGRWADDRRRESPRLRSNSRDRRQKHDKGAGKGKSKGKGKGKASSNPNHPCMNKTPEGRSICSSYNVAKCKANHNQCQLGLHVCNKRVAGDKACSAKHRRCDNH